VKAFDFLSCKRVCSSLWMQSCIPEHVLNVDVAYPCDEALVEQVFLNPSTFSVKHVTEGVYREVIGYRFRTQTSYLGMRTETLFRNEMYVTKPPVMNPDLMSIVKSEDYRSL